MSLTKWCHYVVGEIAHYLTGSEEIGIARDSAEMLLPNRSDKLALHTTRTMPKWKSQGSNESCPLEVASRMGYSIKVRARVVTNLAPFD